MSRAFEQLVAKGVHLERELRAAERWRLSAAAWVASLIETSGVTPQEYGDFKVRVDGKGRDQVPELYSYVYHVVRGLSSGNYHSPPRTQHMNVIRGIAGLDLYEKAKDQAETTGGSIWLLWAMAAAQAGREHPEVFGTDADQRACESKVLDLRNRRAVLLKELNTAWQHDDLHIHDIRSDGAALITFECALPELIPVAPKRDCGERLVNHLANRPDDAAWAA